MGNNNPGIENSDGNNSLNMDVAGIDIPQDNQSDNALKRDEKGRLVKGTPPGPGRPKGLISPITKVKQIFEQDPEKFEAFIEEYIKDPTNRKHIVEMIDGKPKQTLAGDKDNPLRIIAVDSEEALRYGITTSTPEDNTEGQE